MDVHSFRLICAAALAFAAPASAQLGPAPETGSMISSNPSLTSAELISAVTADAVRVNAGSTGPLIHSGTGQNTHGNRPNSTTDRKAAELFDGTVRSIYETPLPSALLLLACGLIVARRAAAGDRRRTRGRAAA
jgi:hypothetical protein